MTPGESGNAVSLVATVCEDRDCELCGGEKVSDEINEGVQVNRIVTPWDKRAIELEEAEGAYCHYAAWLEWFESWNAKQSAELELDLDELERTMLYQAFCDACSECRPMPIPELPDLTPKQ